MHRWFKQVLQVLAAATFVAQICGCSSSTDFSSPRASLNPLRSPASESESLRRFVTKDGTIIEVESAEDQALSAIKAQPTDFELPFPEATYAWERVKLFFSRYTSAFTSEQLPLATTAPKHGAGSAATAATGVVDRNQESVLISNRLAAKDPYIFEVRRSPGKRGLRFIVSVRPRIETKHEGMRHAAQQNPAALQAQNVAHFIRTGSLDTGLTPPRSL